MTIHHPPASFSSHSHSHYTHLYAAPQPQHPYSRAPYTRSRSRSRTTTPTHSPKTSARRSLSSDDEYPYAYDFPQYTYIPPPSPVSSLTALSPQSSNASSSSGGATTVVKNPTTTIRDRNGDEVRDRSSMMSLPPPAPPPTSGRVFHNPSSPCPSTASPHVNASTSNAHSSSSSSSASITVAPSPIYPPPSAFTSSVGRARGPSFASTTSYASSSTTTSSVSAGSSSGGPATPPKGNNLLTPTTGRVYRPLWERSDTRPFGGEEDEGRLDEQAEPQLGEAKGKEVQLHQLPPEIEEDEEGEEDSDEEEYAYGYGYDTRRNSAASVELARYLSYITPSPTPLPLSSLNPRQPKARPRSSRRSPFADDDPAAPYPQHVYLDDDPPNTVTSLTSPRRASSPAPTAARRYSGSHSGSGSSARRWLTDSPRSVARSNSLNHATGRASPARRVNANSPIMMNSLSLNRSNSVTNSRPHSPALSVHSHNAHSNEPSPAHSTTPLRLNVRTNANRDTPSPLHTHSPISIRAEREHEHSRSPSLNELSDRTPELDASPLRTALLLNQDPPEMSLARERDRDEPEKMTFQQEAERRFPGRGLGLGLHGVSGVQGIGGSPKAINAALARRRAEWTEFEGDEYSSTGYANAGRALTTTPLTREQEEGRSTQYGALNLDLNDDVARDSEEEGARIGKAVDLSSPRTSFSAQPRPSLHPYARVSSPIDKRRSTPGGGISYTYAYGYPGESSTRDESSHEGVSDDERRSAHNSSAEQSPSQCSASVSNNAEKKAQNEKVEGGSRAGGICGDGGVPSCLFALRWGVRARWAALKLRVRLGAFRARRRVGLA